MKKKILKLCAAVLAALSLFGCAEITEDGGGNITSFDCPELSGDELVMLPGETSEGWVSPNMRDLDLFSPDEVVFVSEDESVAQIELEEVRADIFLCYKVTAVSVGETYVYAMTTDGSVLTPKQKVTVDSGDEPETAEPLETVPPTPETDAVYETAVHETAVPETAVPETEPETEIETEPETFPETQPETEPAPETLPETETAPETEPIIVTEPESTVPLPFELIPPPETEPEPEETDGGDMELTYETETEPIYEIPPQPEPELDVMSMNDVCEVRMGNTRVNSDTVSNNPLSTYENDTNGVTYVLNTNTKKIHYPSCDSVEKIKPKNYSTTDDYTSAIAQGYVPCKKCNP